MDWQRLYLDHPALFTELSEMAVRQSMTMDHLAGILHDAMLPLPGERRTYPDDTKKMAVAYALKGSFPGAARRYNVPLKLLHNWALDDRYRPGDAPKVAPRTNRRSTPEERQRVADAVLVHGKSRKEAAAEAGVSVMTVYNWVCTAPHVRGGASLT